MRFTVTSLTLAHFRSYQGARLSFDGRPVAVFGPNGAGKTNLLEAISLLSPGRGLRRAAAEDLPRQPAGPGWKVTAALTGPGLAHEVETMAEPGTARQVRINGKAATQAALGRVLRLLWLVPAMDRLWTEGAEGRRRLVDRIALSFDPAHAEAALAHDKALRERNRLLREGVRDAAWYQALEAQMAEAGAALTRNRLQALGRVAAAQAGQTTSFPAAALTLVDPDGAPAREQTPQDLRTALAAGRGRDLAAGRTLAGPHRADLHAVWAAKGIAAARCSTGEQKALLIALILANARALKAELGAAPVLLLDEVAAHLDADRRAALYAEIAALGAQAFMTGTSPDLFSAGGTGFDLIEVSDGADGSTLHRAGE